MSRKARDLLELYRKVDPQPDAVDLLERTPRMLVLRQTQIVVACVAVGLGLMLAFLVGMAAVGDDAPAGDVSPGPWVIRVIDYPDTEKGRVAAQTVASFLEKKGAGEVTIQAAGDRRVVTLGAWVKNPRNYGPAKEKLVEIRETPDIRTGGKPFANAEFWRITR